MASGPFFGNIDLITTQVLVRGEPGMQGAGVSVASGGDIDDDGLPDLLVGADSASGGAAYFIAGAVVRPVGESLPQ